MNLRPGHIALYLLALLLGHEPLAARAQSEADKEAEIKAAFMYNFAKFIDWPQWAFSSAAAPLTLCILGDDPVATPLAAMKSKPLPNRTLSVETYSQAPTPGQCQMLFISRSAAPALKSRLANNPPPATVLVGDTQGFASEGGTIEFYLQDNKVRFIINIRAAEHSGVKISSKLLGLATVLDK